MGNGMTFKAGRDMPPGMQEKMALQIAAGMDADLKQNGWIRADMAKPPLTKKYLKDGSETIEYEESEPVLGYNGRELVVVYLVRDEFCGERWYLHDCEEINVTHWWPNKLPAPPEVKI